MEAAKKLQLYFIGLQRKADNSCRREIVDMEEELKVKKELIKKHEKLLRGWRKEAKDQLDKHNAELDRCSL
ncbi:hypothetical protein CFOL_v3_11974 [Cephalotus follicularis]|uniref:Uncharacterized protein n=1 Tax=Cephalotus follicularis TaxID=3775 RepID=A0A1Q3BKD9_CEPFO|nr:hypothetical protein CFOL_v3_11974 [Cephalotus follicularis]